MNIIRHGSSMGRVVAPGAPLWWPKKNAVDPPENLGPELPVGGRIQNNVHIVPLPYDVMQIVTDIAVDPFISYTVTTGAAIGGRTFRVFFELWTDPGQDEGVSVFAYDYAYGNEQVFPVGAPTYRSLRSVDVTFPPGNADTEFIFMYGFATGASNAVGEYFYITDPVVREVLP